MSAHCTAASRVLDDGLPLISIVEAAAENGVTTHPKTGLRHAIKGRRGIRLETIKVGGKRLTTSAAYRRFLLAQAALDASNEPQKAVLDPKAADRVLDAHGLPRKGA